MADVDFDALKTALSEEAPCGPDLDMEFDDDYMNFVANLEGFLPTTFFSESGPFSFDPSVIDVAQQRKRCLELLERTRDLRLLVLLARLYILSRDLGNFARSVEVVASLLETFWEPVHPQAEGGQFAMRAAILNMLDEPTVVFSLQYCRLCETRRQGPVTFRSYLYAVREAEAREGEEVPSESTLMQAIRDSEEQIVQTRKDLEILLGALQKIISIWAAHADFMSAPKLANVTGVIGRILELIQRAFPTAVPAATATDGGEDDQGRVGATSITSARQATRALKVAIEYFKSREPSSPVLPLIVQAEKLIGKSFPEILAVLLPDQVSSATFQIGGRQYFELPLERLPAFEMPDLSDGDRDEAPEPAGQFDPSDAQTDQDQSEDGQALVPAPVPPPPASDYVANTRPQALGLLDDITVYLRASEPGSPIPWLIERARALADRDFLSVLRAVLPAKALKDLDQN